MHLLWMEWRRSILCDWIFRRIRVDSIDCWVVADRRRDESNWSAGKGSGLVVAIRSVFIKVRRFYAFIFLMLHTTCFFSSNHTSFGELLVVADWSQSVGFYIHDNGLTTFKSDKALNYDPTSIQLFSNGCFFFATGTNKKLNLHTREGEFLLLIFSFKWVF